MDVHHMKYFLALCETLNFTRAAAQCHVSQPALSRSVMQLECEFGGPLFKRDRGGVVPTELCRLLQPHVGRVLDGIETTRREARRFLENEGARVRLGVMSSIGPVQLMGILTKFKTEHPGITLRVTEAMPDTLTLGLESGDVDVALMAHPDGFAAHLWWRELYRERFVLAFAASHRFAALDSVTFADIDGENYLKRTNCEYAAHIGQICDDMGIAMRAVFESRREDWIQSQVANGHGVCLVPELNEVPPGVAVRPLTGPGLVRSVCMVRNGGEPLPATQLFVDSLRCLDASEYLL